MKGIFIPDITSEMFRNGCLEAIEALMAEGEIYDIEYDPSAQPEFVKDINVPVNDTISRQAAIDATWEEPTYTDPMNVLTEVRDRINNLPSAQPERLTDKEQRIFLVAMGREEKVCKEVDRKYQGEPYEDSLVRVCREIERKVKGALWT